MSFIGGFLSESILAVSGFVLMSFGFNELRKRNIIPFPKHGLTLKAILKFIERNGGRERFQGLTTTQVCEDVLKIITSKRQCSYCDLLLFEEEEKEEEDGDAVVDDGVADKKLKSVGKAGVFISHAWKYNFLDVVSALENHFKDTPETIIWFDLFSNNQHLAVSLPFEWWATTFKSAIQEMGRTVMVLAPWRDPIPFTRAWCLFEIYSTVITESHFEVAMSESEKDKFLDEICIDNGAFYKMLGDVDVRKSEAWNPKDKARIFEVAEKEVGFPKLNAMVSVKMRSWVSLTLKNSISAPGLSKEDELKRKMGYARILFDTAHFDEALRVYQECSDGYIALHGSENHVDVATTYNNIANVYNNQGQNDKALEKYEQALEIRITKLGADHSYVADSYNNIACVYYNQGEYDKAL
jgi:tetratricopeptide (TPR) repeat protein